MVLYGHVFAGAGVQLTGNAFMPVPWIRQSISTPLGIIQDFGWMGVCLFFLISGFVITNSARQEPFRVFAIRRLFRILPPLAITVLLVAVTDRVSGVQRPLTDYLQGLSLSGYFTTPQVIVIHAAWTLVIEVLFYTLIAIVSPWLRGGRPVVGIALASLLPPLAIVFSRDFGPSFFLFATSMAYLPVLLIGSTIYLSKATSTGLGMSLLIVSANFAVFLLGLHRIHTAFLPIDNSYLLSVAYAITLFVLCIDRGGPRPLRFVGDISYSLYLIHGSIGLIAMRWALGAKLGQFAPWLTCAVCIAVAWLMCLAIERPAIAAGKRLAGGQRPGTVLP